MWRTPQGFTRDLGSVCGRRQGAERRVPEHLEVAHVPFERGGPYPGIYLFSSAARMARPVRQLPHGSLELVGALEQAHLAVRCDTTVIAGLMFQSPHPSHQINKSRLHSSCWIAAGAVSRRSGGGSDLQPWPRTGPRQSYST